jgi:hypothetical protein
MKRKRTNWDNVRWTPFERTLPSEDARIEALNRKDPPAAYFYNSRYQVTVYEGRMPPPYGRIVHLSFKTHDRQARHDWRDMQRIKNELVGEEFDAVEVYPAESKLVDLCNQYHLTVFLDWKLPFGFQTRCVADGKEGKGRQRPWADGERPADCRDVGAVIDEQLRRAATR